MPAAREIACSSRAPLGRTVVDFNEAEVTVEIFHIFAGFESRRHDLHAVIDEKIVRTPEKSLVFHVNLCRVCFFSGVSNTIY